jgi:hypothetical protein
MDFIPRNLTVWVALLACLSISGIDGPPAVEAFSVQPALLQPSSFAHRTGSVNTQQRCSSWTMPTPTPLRQSSLLHATPPGGRKKRNSEDDEDPDERELVPVRRRKGGASKYYDQDDDQDEAYEKADDKGSYYYEDDEDDDEFEDDDDDDWEDDDEDDDDDVEVNYDYLFENTVIPNPLLDSIDPDGAADRFPELARDPRFWFDMALFVAFLNFLSFAGPRDPFPDIPFF